MTSVFTGLDGGAVRRCCWSFCKVKSGELWQICALAVMFLAHCRSWTPLSYTPNSYLQQLKCAHKHILTHWARTYYIYLHIVDYSLAPQLRKVKERCALTWFLQNKLQTTFTGKNNTGRKHKTSRCAPFSKPNTHIFLARISMCVIIVIHISM